MLTMPHCLSCNGTGYVHHKASPVGPFQTVKCQCVHVRRHYDRYRAKGCRASDALRSARIVAAFEAEDGCAKGGDYDGLVKLEAEPECDSHDSMYGRSDDEREAKAIDARIDRDGFWCLVAYFRANDTDLWEHVDSIGGFIGDDWIDSGYDVDLMASALDALDRARTDEAADIEASATYAMHAP